MIPKVQCQTRCNLPIYKYPAALEASKVQLDIIWPFGEPKIEKDLHCLKVELPKPDLHGVMTTLKLFTLYEITAGQEYWGGRFKRMFPRNDFRRMAATFACVEEAVHAPFYGRVDELLGLNTNEFYTSFTDDPVLKARMDFLDDACTDEDDAFSVGVFSMIEGCILYSSFAFLMHFQAQGKNYLPNMVSGITFSVKDENLHSEGGAWAFRTLQEERKEAGVMPEGYEENLHKRIYEAAEKIYEHECYIIDMIFAEGPIKGITAKQLKAFVQSRIDLCLKNLGLDAMFKPTYNPIAKWFYDMIGGDVQNDFFFALSSAYNRDWSEKGFKWTTTEMKKKGEVYVR